MKFVRSSLPVLVSSLITLIVAEAAVQAFVNPSKLYSNIDGSPEAKTWYREIKFWDQHREHRDFANNHDPRLGWDFEIDGDRIRGDRSATTSPSTDLYRIVAIGDSFTYGLDVGAHENFVALLDEMPEVETLNMGVSGYGIDQAFLKFVNHGMQYQPDLVLFGIYVSDYERASLGFTYFAKPQFRRRGSEMVLLGQPVPLPQDEFDRIDREISNKFYIVELLSNAWRKIAQSATERARYFDETDEVVRHILSSLQRHLADRQNLLVIHIPSAKAFIQTDEYKSEMSNRLLEIYRDLDIHHLDLASEFVVDQDPRAVFEEYYVHFENGSVGHLSSTGHARVVQLIRSALNERGILETQGNDGSQQ